MKHLLTTAIVALSATLAIGAPSGEDTRARSVPTVTGDGTTIYGEVTHSNSMDITSADGLAWGLYSFNASSPMTVSPCRSTIPFVRTEAEPTAKASSISPATTRT